MLDPRITDLRPEWVSRREFVLFDGRDDEARFLGLHVTGAEDLMVAVTDPGRPIGNMQVYSGGHNNLLCFDNAAWTGHCVGMLRMLGNDGVAYFGDIGDGYARLDDILMRSNDQLLFWGTGTTAVGLSVEIEGVGRSVAFGDDGLISNGVWVRNYDMHAVHDLNTGAQINRAPCDTVVERHVWLGQDALLLHCERVGMGTVVGARSLLKGSAPPCVVVAGTPAGVIRRNASWGRHPYGITREERASIGMLGGVEP